MGDRFGIGAGRHTRGDGTETQQGDECNLPVDDVRQKKNYDVAATDSALLQLFGEASGLPPQHAVAKPPTGCIGDGEAAFETLGEDGIAVAQALAWPPPHRAVPAFTFGRGRQRRYPETLLAWIGSFPDLRAEPRSFAAPTVGPDLLQFRRRPLSHLR